MRVADAPLIAPQSPLPCYPNGSTQLGTEGARAMTDWVDVKGEFVRDAFCFREIHVGDAIPLDWQRMLAALPKSAWRWVYQYDEKVRALPTSFSASLQQQGSPYLRIDQEGLELRCDFLEEDDLEFFFDVASVQNEPAFERLLEFMRWLCNVLGKHVALFHETPLAPFSDAILYVTPDFRASP